MEVGFINRSLNEDSWIIAFELCRHFKENFNTRSSFFRFDFWSGHSVAKSAAHCSLNNATRLIRLCEVAIGLSDIRFHYDQSKLIDLFESVQAIGLYNPKANYVRSDGLNIPNGKLHKRNWHQFQRICRV